MSRRIPTISSGGHVRGPYEAAVEVGGVSPLLSEWTRHSVRALARRCDLLRSEVIDQSRRAARVFEDVAAGFLRGETYTSNPLGHSAVTDLPMLIAELAAVEGLFWDVLRDALRDNDAAVPIAEVMTAARAEVKSGQDAIARGRAGR